MKDEYTRHEIANIFNIHKIAILNHFTFSESFCYKKEKHGFWELVYVDQGCLTVETEKETLTLHANECVFHKPGESHIHRSEGNAQTGYTVIGFVCSSPVMQHFREKSMKIPPKLRHYMTDILEEAGRAFSLLFNDPDNQKLLTSDSALIGGQQMIKSYLEQFLILLIRQLQALPLSPHKSKEENLVSQIKNKFDFLLYTDINIEAFCREMNYSRSYLSKLFHRETGMTMGEYITLSKINEAKVLMESNSYTLSQISDMLSFSNPLYFSRVFKKITGMSPSEYKKEK